MSKSNEMQMLPEEAKRLEVYNEMSKDLRKVADDFEKKESSIAKGNLMSRYDMGTKLKEVIAEEATYGSNAVFQLAKYLGKTDTELYAYRGVATVYTRDEAEAFAQRKMANGGHISWMHLTAIVEIKRANDRKKMWERVFNESLSATQVKTEALASMDKGRRGIGGGRKPSRPTSPLAGTTEIYRQCHGINTRMENWQEGVFDAMDGVEPDKVEAIYVEKLEAAIAEVQTASGNLSQVEDRLQKNLKRAKAIVEKHEKAAKEAADAAADAEAQGGEEGEAGEEGGGKRRGRRPAAAVA